VYKKFWWENLWERDHLEVPGVDVWIILRWIFRKWDGVNALDCSGLEKNRWCALVNAVMNLRVP
jgi:hypothetical protein